jgi:hypothetical protein
MSRTLQFKRYSNTALLSVTGATAELIVDSTNKTITVHDGSTAGGTRLATETFVGKSPFTQAAFNKANSANSLAQAAFNYANTIVSDSQIDNVARIVANSTAIVANIVAAGLVSTNTNTAIALAGVTAANANILISLAGVNAANSNISFLTGFSQGAYDKANTTATVSNSTAVVANIVSAGLVATNTNTSIALAGTAVANANITLLFGLSTAQNTLSQTIFTAANNAAQTIPQNAQAVNYVLQSSDAGKHLYYTNSSAVNLYIPWTANTSWSNGTSITIISQTGSSANVTILPNTGVSLFLAGNTTSNSRIVTTYGMASLIMVKANTWFINGTGVV